MGCSSAGRHHSPLVAAAVVEPLAVRRRAVPEAELVPDRPQGQRLVVLDQRKASGEVARALEAPQLRRRLKQAGEQALLRVAGADGPRGDPVDAGVKEI